MESQLVSLVNTTGPNPFTEREEKCATRYHNHPACLNEIDDIRLIKVMQRNSAEKEIEHSNSTQEESMGDRNIYFTKEWICHIRLRLMSRVEVYL